MKESSALCACALFAVAAAAPTAADAQIRDDWSYALSIYAYVPSFSGSTAFPPPAGGRPINADGGELMDKLQGAFMGSFEAVRGRWGVYTDIIYLQLGESRSGTRGIEIGGALPVGVSASTDFDLRGWMWTLAGLYRVQSSPRYSYDIVGGLRALDISQRLGFSLEGSIGNLPPADISGTRNTDARNWDAIIGVKGRARFADRSPWFVPYYVDIGTGDSKFTWQAMAGVGYSFGWGDIVGSWRYIDYRMKNDTGVRELTLNGPSIGAVFRW
jgi:hypothetical protein